MRKALVLVFLVLIISAVFAQNEFSDCSTGDECVLMSFDEEQEQFDDSAGEEQNTLIFGKIKRAFRRGFERVKSFGRRAASRVGDFGKKAFRATSNVGEKAWRSTRNFSVSTYNKAKNVFVPTIPKNLGVKKASSTGPRYTRQIRSLEEAVHAYTPIVYLSRGEKWFPTSAEKLGNWNQVPYSQLDNKSWILPLHKHLNRFDRHAPVYVNVRTKAVPGKVLISYGFLYHYNDCGPHVRVAAAASFIKFDQTIYACPIGIHDGDIEHVTLQLDARTLRVDKVYYAFHQFDDVVKPTEVEWEGTRPVFYSAKGSHATYLTPEKQQYVQVWKESAKGAYTFGFLEDYPERGLRWTPVARWLAIDGQIRSGLTYQEDKFARFKGTIGVQIKKQSAEKLKKALFAITYPARKIKSSWNSKISEQINSLDGQLQPTAIGGLGDRDWFKASVDPIKLID